MVWISVFWKKSFWKKTFWRKTRCLYDPMPISAYACMQELLNACLGYEPIMRCNPAYSHSQP